MYIARLVFLSVLALFTSSIWAQTLPIGQRVTPKYSVTVKVPERKMTVTLVMNERVNSGDKMQSMREYMHQVVQKTCPEKCGGREMEIVQQKIMQEAIKKSISASHVIIE